MFPLFSQEEVKRLASQYQSFFASLEDPAQQGLRPNATPFHGTAHQGCACPFFNPNTHECGIYPDRPLDCQLYPFVLTLGLTEKRVVLGLDTQCPFVQDLTHQTTLLEHGKYLRDALENKEPSHTIHQASGLIKQRDETILPLFPLPELTKRFFRETLFGNPLSPTSGWRPLTEKNWDKIREFFSVSSKHFAGDTLLSLVALSHLMRFYWREEKDALFIVAEQGGHFFMPLPPLTKTRTPEILKRGFALLAPLNPKAPSIRMEGLTEAEALSLKEDGYVIHTKNPEYVYSRKALVDLLGDPYKSKRNLYNYFTKHYSYSYVPYDIRDFWACLHLLKKWQSKKIQKVGDPYTLALLEDATFIHSEVLLQGKKLQGEGRVVKIGGEVQGYTFGYPLDTKTWCVLLEIADPEIKGLSQFLFREFCKEKETFEWVNAMDDSDLEALRKAKESYSPSFKKTPFVALREV